MAIKSARNKTNIPETAKSAKNNENAEWITFLLNTTVTAETTVMNAKI